MRLRLALFFSVAAAVACGLFLDGPGGDDAGSSDGAPPVADAAQDTKLPPPCPTLDASACLGDANVPDGWALVGVSVTDPCPTEFTPSPLVTDPQVEDGGCACGACQTQGAYDCNGAVTIHAGAVCVNLGTIKVDAGQCFKLGLGGATFNAGPPAIGGNVSCSSPGDAGTGAVTAKPITACTPTSCKADYCGLGGAFKRCVVSEGNVPCPAGFTRYASAGTGAQLTSCACSCKLQNAACTGTIHAYTSDNCTGNPTVDPGDGGCVQDNQNYGSVLYASDPAPVPACAAIEPGVAEAGLIGSKTICCL